MKVYLLAESPSRPLRPLDNGSGYSAPRFFRQPNKGGEEQRGGEVVEEEWKEDKGKRKKRVRERSRARARLLSASLPEGG